MTAGDRSETTWRPSPKVNNKLGPSEAVPEGERSAGGAAAAAAAAVDLEKGGRGASKAGDETEKEGGALVLVGCFVGLQVAYLSWGVLQERMMTKEYESAGPDGTIERSMFPSVTFIVFANRLLAFFTAVALVLCDSSAVPFFGPAGLIQGDGLLGKVRAPLEMFAPASLSNVMSSFFQYKALVYVSFPTQVLFKSNKIIPTMLMGIALNGKSYKLHEYFQALTISAAVAAFMISEKGSEADESAEEPSSPFAGGAVLGIVCLCLYLCCDSFTSQWQSRVFKKWKVSQYQMMLGVNAFSLMYTFAKAAAFGEFIACVDFLFVHPLALIHITLFSLASSVGQLFIFYTIKRFGPVIFSMMMTTRQVLSMVLSCLLFGHQLGAVSIFCASVVFAVLGIRIKSRMKK